MSSKSFYFCYSLGNDNYLITEYKTKEELKENEEHWIFDKNNFIIEGEKIFL